MTNMKTINNVVMNDIICFLVQLERTFFPNFKFPLDQWGEFKEPMKHTHSWKKMLMVDVLYYYTSSF